LIFKKNVVRLVTIVLLCSVFLLYDIKRVFASEDNDQHVPQFDHSHKQNTYIINEILRFLPSRTSLNSIRKTSENIIITGHALTLSDAESFKHNLKASSLLQQIDFKTKPEIVRSNATYGFTVSTKLVNDIDSIKGFAESNIVCVQIPITSVTNVDKLSHLVDVIKASRLDVLTFKPNEESIENGCDELPVEISVRGTFYNLIAFIDEINKLPYFAILGDFAIEQAGFQQSMKTTVSVYRYYGKPAKYEYDHHENVCTPVIGTQVSDQFDFNRVAHLKRLIETQNNKAKTDYPLAAFRVVGIMQLSNGAGAIVKTSEKEYVVKVGDIIGMNGGVITKITSDSIVVREITNDSTGNISENIITLILQPLPADNRNSVEKAYTQSSNDKKPKPPKPKRKGHELANVLQKFIGEKGGNQVLHVDYSRMSGEWAWIQASPKSTDSNAQTEPVQALLKKQGKDWNVIYVRPKHDDCIKDPDCADDKKMHIMIRNKFGSVPMFIFP